MDAATPAVDTTNETSGPPGLNNIDGVRSIAAAHTVGKTMGDQLAGVGLSLRSFVTSWTRRPALVTIPM
jgi:phosphatidylinositol-3-phosphatase